MSFETNEISSYVCEINGHGIILASFRVLPLSLLSLLLCPVGSLSLAGGTGFAAGWPSTSWRWGYLSECGTGIALAPF